MSNETEPHCAFEPEMIEAMARAHVEACIALSILAGDHRGREGVASRVIAFAKAGLTDASALRDSVLIEAAGSARPAKARAPSQRLAISPSSWIEQATCSSGTRSAAAVSLRR
jgi:hypothetical protein